jgi:hypothetical protein
LLLRRRINKLNFDMKRLLLSCFLAGAMADLYGQAANNVLNSSGNAGIGTTSPTSYSGYSVLSMDNATNGGIIDFRKNGTVFGGLWGDALGMNLSSSYGYNLHLYTDGIERMTILRSGHVGMGQLIPRARLELSPPIGTGPAAIFRLNGGQAWGSVLTLETDNPSGDDPRLLFSYRGGAKHWALGGYSNTSGATARFSVWEDAGDGVFGGTGFGTERLTVLPGGNVGIGTKNPDEMLTVNGKIHAKEVRIDTSVPTPDYVFNKNYPLMSLTEVKNYIDKNHHLPDVPSAAEVEKDGLKLGEMNLILLKKVEELTLHLIEKDKQVKELNERIIIIEKTRSN